MKPLIKIYKEGSDFRATVSVPERWGLPSDDYSEGDQKEPS